MKLRLVLAVITLFPLSFGILAQAQMFPSVKEIFVPPYPPTARAVHAEGDVEVAVEVDESGRVLAAVPRTGHPLLRAASRAAAERWTFVSIPGRHFLTLRFEFRLGDFDEKKKAKLVGSYTLRNVEPETRILQTVNHSSQFRAK